MSLWIVGSSSRFVASATAFRSSPAHGDVGFTPAIPSIRGICSASSISRFARSTPSVSPRRIAR